MISCNILKITGDNVWSYMAFYHKLMQVETCLKNCHTKPSHIKSRDNLTLKSILFHSMIKLAHGLISFQRQWASFLRNSIYMQGNETIFVLIKMAQLYLQEEILA